MLPFSDWTPFETQKQKREKAKLTQEKINKLIDNERRWYFQDFLDKNNHSVAPRLDYELDEQQKKITKIHKDISEKKRPRKNSSYYGT